MLRLKKKNKQKPKIRHHQTRILFSQYTFCFVWFLPLKPQDPISPRKIIEIWFKMSKRTEGRDPGKEELGYMDQFNFSVLQLITAQFSCFVSPLVGGIKVSLTHEKTVLAYRNGSASAFVQQNNCHVQDGKPTKKPEQPHSSTWKSGIK